MQVNRTSADKFMQVADVRKDIVIVTKPELRSLEYDQLGPVKVGSQLRISRFGRGGNPVLDVQNQSDAWYISVDDQLLSRRVLEKADKGKTIDDLFTQDFKREVNKGIKSILLKEKILNSENYNFALFSGYIAGFLVADSIVHAMADISTRTIVEIGANYAQMVVQNMFVRVIASLDENLLFFRASKKGFSPFTATPNDPFVKNKYRDFILPIIPVDRLARGLYYLKVHGDKIISTDTNSEPT
jgi:hypothetical protein